MYTAYTFGIGILQIGQALVHNGGVIQYADRPKRKYCTADAPDGQGRISILNHRCLPLTTAQQRAAAENMGLVGLFIHVRTRPWATEYVRRHGLDEFKSTAQTILCIASAKHDPAKGKLSTLFSLMLHQTVCKVLTRETGSQLLQLEEHEDDNGNEVVSHESVQDDAALARVDDMDGLLAGLKTLTPRERRVIKARFWGGATFPEIARGIDVSAQRTREIQRTALVKLRAAY